MNRVLRAVITHLLSKRCIGGKHTPEDKLIKSKAKWIDKKENKQFQKEYSTFKKEGFIICLKKRTGKSFDWHISLNPRKLKELHEIIK